ncbi:MAG: hypothetical protein WBA85_03895 [Brucella anthropi]
MDVANFLSNPAVSIPLTIVLSLVTALLYDVLKALYQGGSSKRLKDSFDRNIDSMYNFSTQKGRHIIIVLFIRDSVMLILSFIIMIFVNIFIFTQTGIEKIANGANIDQIYFDRMNLFINYGFTPLSFVLSFVGWIFMYRVFYYWPLKFPRIIRPSHIARRIKERRGALGEQNFTELMTRLNAFADTQDRSQRD